jgi:uncharacterized protein (DUF58 family)
MTDKAILSPEALGKLSNLELRARLVVEGFLTGLHKSPYHGFSVEFSQHRPYNPGDDLRFIDWRVLARSDRYYIKQFEEETNLKAHILLDISNSMAYTSSGNSKMEYGKQLAAALSYLLLMQRDAAGLVMFDEKIRKLIPARSVMSYYQTLIAELEKAESGTETDIADVLHEMAERIGRRGLIIIISDMFDEPERLLSGLRHFRHNGHEVLVFQLLDRQEVDFNFQGDVIFKDMESGDELRTFPWYVKNEYREKMGEFVEQLKTQCLSNRIDYQLMITDEPMDAALLEFLKKRKRLR